MVFLTSTFLGSLTSTFLLQGFMVFVGDAVFETEEERLASKPYTLNPTPSTLHSVP